MNPQLQAKLVADLLERVQNFYVDLADAGLSMKKVSVDYSLSSSPASIIDNKPAQFVANTPEKGQVHYARDSQGRVVLRENYHHLESDGVIFYSRQGQRSPFIFVRRDGEIIQVRSAPLNAGDSPGSVIWPRSSEVENVVSISKVQKVEVLNDGSFVVFANGQPLEIHSISGDHARVENGGLRYSRINVVDEINRVLDLYRDERGGEVALATILEHPLRKFLSLLSLDNPIVSDSMVVPFLEKYLNLFRNPAALTGNSGLIPNYSFLWKTQEALGATLRHVRALYEGVYTPGVEQAHSAVRSDAVRSFLNISGQITQVLHAARQLEPGLVAEQAYFTPHFDWQKLVLVDDSKFVEFATSDPTVKVRRDAGGNWILLKNGVTRFIQGRNNSGHLLLSADPLNPSILKHSFNQSSGIWSSVTRALRSRSQEILEGYPPSGTVFQIGEFNRVIFNELADANQTRIVWSADGVREVSGRDSIVTYHGLDYDIEANNFSDLRHNVPALKEKSYEGILSRFSFQVPKEERAAYLHQANLIVLGLRSATDAPPQSWAQRFDKAMAFLEEAAAVSNLIAQARQTNAIAAKEKVQLQMRMDGGFGEQLSDGRIIYRTQDSALVVTKEADGKLILTRDGKEVAQDSSRVAKEKLAQSSQPSNVVRLVKTSPLGKDRPGNLLGASEARSRVWSPEILPLSKEELADIQRFHWFFTGNSVERIRRDIDRTRSTWASLQPLMEQVETLRYDASKIAAELRFEESRRKDVYGYTEAQIDRE